MHFPKMLQYSSASIIPSKIQIFIAPCLLIPAQMCTFKGCFGFGVLFWWLSYLAYARSAELLKGDGALICENNVVKCITSLYNLLGKLKPLDLVCVTNQLAISGVLQSPALFLL